MTSARHAAIAVAAALLLPLSGGIAQAAVIDSAPGGFTLENSETVPTTPDRAWQALVDHVGQWWPADHTWWGDASKLSIEPRIGGCFCERNGAQQAWHMSIAFVDPGKLLRMTGGLGPLQGMGVGGALDWRFEAVDGGTRITLHYRAGGYAPEDLSKFAPVVDHVQAQQLGGLANYLRKTAEGGK
ncbi:MAG TPA: SRPBCC family protein [Fontimonas sp.]